MFPAKKVVTTALLLATSGLLLAQQPAPLVAKGPFEFNDGDRLMLLGNTVIEREQRYGTFEPLLSLALGEKKVSIRNLGWSGDTVFGDARSYFGPPQEGLERLSRHVELVKPTVVLMCYGSEMGFERLRGLPEFLTGYRTLIELVRAKAPGVRIVITAPPPLENLPPPLPDQTDANKALSSFRDALRKFAGSQNTYFVDLFELMGGIPKAGPVAEPLTENGVHYLRHGYEKLSAKLIEGLGLRVPHVPSAELEPLRREVLRKDELFFNRWRPQNETYLFGFRKHEQGQNAAEIPMFDPLINQADTRIQEAKTALLASKKTP